MQCRQAVELVSDHLDNALPGLVNARFESHLAACRDCSLYQSQMSMTVVLARTIGRPGGTDPDLYRRLLELSRRA